MCFCRSLASCGWNGKRPRLALRVPGLVRNCPEVQSWETGITGQLPHHVYTFWQAQAPHLLDVRVGRRGASCVYRAAFVDSGWASGGWAPGDKPRSHIACTFSNLSNFESQILRHSHKDPLTLPGGFVRGSCCVCNASAGLELSALGMCQGLEASKIIMAHAPQR